jgi:hypothetical protein
MRCTCGRLREHRPNRDRSSAPVWQRLGFDLFPNGTSGSITQARVNKPL